ncbi:MAG: FecR domain-containing protein [Anaerolineales bacterium]|nr:FecR domain-containing protein [Anaerolineales bacterium]
MSELMVKMAKQASEDDSLMAWLICHYGEIKGMRWEEIATQLWIDDSKLAKLALCRRPDQLKFTKDVTQIAKYAGIERRRLVQFIEAAESAQVAQVAAQQKAVQKRQTWRSRSVALAFGFAALFLILLGSFLFQPTEEYGATLVVSDGQVVVSRIEKLFYIAPVSKDQIALAGEDIAIKAGDTIMVGKAAFAQLRLADGSTVDLLENTRLVIERLSISEDAYQVRLSMRSGSSINHVQHLLAAGDLYEVSTPSSTISVRGTVFKVQVLSPEWTYIACSEGVVYLTTGNYSLEIYAGQETYARLGQPLKAQPIGSPTPTEAPTPLPDVQSTPAPLLGSPPIQGTPAGGGTGEGGGPNLPVTEAPGGASPTEEGIKQVPGKPPGDNPNNPAGGGDPPGQSKKDHPQKDR